MPPEQWTRKPEACPLMVCAVCGATSNRTSTFAGSLGGRLWSAAGTCHLTPDDESNWVLYVPAREAADAV